MNNKTLRYKKVLIAQGNPTLLVWNCPLEKREDVIEEYLGEVEQIGFIDKENKLTMMGNELSINSIIAFASCLKKKGKLFSSGLKEKVQYQNESDVTTITFSMPFQEKENTILFPGIGYAYITKDPYNIKESLRTLSEKYNLPAFGYVSYEGKKMTVYVYVAATNSLFKETSCGSGSIALSIFLGIERITQPTGDIITVKRTNNDFSISANIKTVEYENIYGMIKKMNTQTLKGFRDFLPLEKRKRDFVTGKIKEVFERFGFEPIETPTLEYADLLLGKYGDEADKLVYTFEDKGERKVGLRYDQTVPTARFLAQYYNQLPKYFRRYQIQNVFRADKPQKGRFREFTQCDADIFGSTSPLADAEILALVYTIFRNVGFTNCVIKVNDRQTLLNTLSPFATENTNVFSIIQSVDKLDKQTPEEITKELVQKGIPEQNAQKLLDAIGNAMISENLKNILSETRELGVPEKALTFSPALARGLDYYTGMIFEVIVPSYTVGSCGGGGRFDNLINQLSGNNIPAVGFGLGFDRMVEAADELNLFPKTIYESAKVLVTIFDLDTKEASLNLASRLREAGIAAELWIEPTTKLDKQLKYAISKGIPYVALLGPEELKKGTITLKNLVNREQKEVSFEDIVSLLTAK